MWGYYKGTNAYTWNIYILLLPLFATHSLVAPMQERARIQLLDVKLSFTDQTVQNSNV